MSAECIYLSDWTPRGVRKEWERCSLAVQDAQRLIGDWDDGKVLDACGWFAQDDRLRVMVADLDSGTRVTYRRTKRGSSLQFGRKP